MTGNNTDPDDMVNHPIHYNRHKSGVECIDVVEHMSFPIGSAIKYLWRADEKGNAVEDLKKARFYIQREIDRRTQTTGSVAQRLEDLKPALQDVLAEMPMQMQPDVSIYGTKVHNTFHTSQDALKYSHMTRVVDDTLVVVHPQIEYEERADCMIGKQLVERSLHKTMNEYVEYVVNDFAGKVTDVAERYPEEQDPTEGAEPPEKWVDSGHQVKLEQRDIAVRVKHSKKGCPGDGTCTVYRDLEAMSHVKTSLEHHLGMWFDVMVDGNGKPVMLQTDKKLRVKL